MLRLDKARGHVLAYGQRHLQLITAQLGIEPCQFALTGFSSVSTWARRSSFKLAVTDKVHPCLKLEPPHSLHYRVPISRPMRA